MSDYSDHDMDSLMLLKELVRIPSDRTARLEGGLFEFGIARFLREYIQQNLPDFEIEEQEVLPGRVNLFIHGKAPISLLLIGHMDTVEPGAGWTRVVSGEEVGDHFYGRGSADMKAGIVAILEALGHATRTKKQGVAALFYCDEEYELVGMRRFVEKYQGILKPRLVIAPEPTDGKLRRGCRGIFEARFVVRGKRGHAARPKSGKNAFEAFECGLIAVRRLVSQSRDAFLGNATLNVAGVRCGALQTGAMGEDVKTIGNVIPDYCEATLEIRLVPGLARADIESAFRREVEAFGCELVSVTVALDIGSFVTDSEKLVLVEEVQQRVYGQLAYEDAERGGYSDVQMIAAAWNVPAVVWGPAGGNMHGSDEYVELPSIEQFSAALRLLIDKWDG